MHEWKKKEVIKRAKEVKTAKRVESSKKFKEVLAHDISPVAMCLFCHHISLTIDVTGGHIRNCIERAIGPGQHEHIISAINVLILILISILQATVIIIAESVLTHKGVSSDH